MTLIRAAALGMCATLVILGQQTFRNVTYEGGSFSLAQHSKVNLKVDSKAITFTGERQQFSLATSSITGVFYGGKVHRRVKTAVAVGLLVSPLAVPILLSRKTDNRAIGLTWTETDTGKQCGAILRVVSDSQYRVILAALSAATGRKAVNTDLASGGQANIEPVASLPPTLVQTEGSAPSQEKPAPKSEVKEMPCGPGWTRIGNGGCTGEATSGASKVEATQAETEEPPSPQPLQQRRPAITLGMSGSDVRALLGTPLVYRQSQPARNFPSSAAGVLPPSSDYFDVYEIKTSLNTYELWINYAMDDSESRLHPVPRVVAIHFELDRRIGVSDVAKVLDDIPEVTVLCGAECTVASERQQGSGGGDRLYLHPRTLTSADLAKAELIGSMFGRFPAGGFVGIRKPTIWVIYERGFIIQLMLHEDDSHFEGPVQGAWKPQGRAN